MFYVCFIRVPCWLCDAMFSNQTSLKQHLTGPAHSRLTVICPYCTGKEKTFTRLSDLKSHCNNLHKSKDSAIMNRGVGFYLAKYPTDYARIADLVEAYDSPGATKARSLMRDWAESQPNPREVQERLNSGWKKGADEIDERGDRRRVVQRSSRSKERQEKSARSSEDRTGGQSKERSGKRDGHKEGRKEGREGQSEERRDKLDRNSGERSERSKGHNKERRDGQDRWSEESREKCEEQSKGNGERKDRESKEGGDIQDCQGEARWEEASDERRDTGKEEESSGDTPRGEKRKRAEMEDKEELPNLDYEDDLSDEDSFSSASSSSSSTDSEAGELTLPSGPDGQLKRMATRILMRGAMPLCPPAQRDWSLGKTVTVTTPNGDLRWPPKGWRNMSADQRLLAQEYAAMQLERGQGNGEISLSLSRRTLVDKYQFLSLEGDSKPSGRVTPDAKVRYYNFLVVMKAARGQADLVEEHVVKALYRADRWCDTDFITDMLDKAEIKMRI